MSAGARGRARACSGPSARRRAPRDARTASSSSSSEKPSACRRSFCALNGCSLNRSAASFGFTPSAASRLSDAQLAEMAPERAGEPRRDVAPRLRVALEDRLAHVERASRVVRRPRLGELVDRQVGVRERRAPRPRARRSALPQPRSRACPPRTSAPRIVADELDERRRPLRARRARRGRRNCPATHSCSPFFSTSYARTLAGLRARLPERRGRLQLLGDEREHGRRRRAREVVRRRVDVRRLPAALAPSLAVLAPVDVADDDQSRVAEQAARVAQADGLLARRVERADRLDRLRLEVAREAA